MEMETRKCLNCGKGLQGRVDKKFCDDYCRNNYNNHRNGTTNNLIRNINYALKKNRNILASLLPEQEDTAKTTREKLLHQGFQFRYNTHTYTNKKGNVYGYCYDYGYLELDHDWYLIVRNREA
ncbi:hypothetical protein [Pleomorphovibrio marinus]|uniref:hypothetical protein n=1 Tax=Pleomorphovibrio marinus TaxID=2164132 RepID=UPI0018E52CD0|nr:hypothetical protein [Pleomorphovibrio marinus]